MTPRSLLSVAASFGAIVGIACVPFVHDSKAHQAEAITKSVHYSPDEDIEWLDLAALRSGDHLNIAMYSFSDVPLAHEVALLARAGRVVKIYRDGAQFKEEQERARNVMTFFRGEPNIHIRVKPPSRSDLMHLKAFSTGVLLRDGSANWSPAGLHRQDNEVRFTIDRAQVEAFEAEFNEIWERKENIVIQ